MAIASYLIAASGAIFLLLGAGHLLLTYLGQLLSPRDATLRTHMRQSYPVITRETTMWSAWQGFNASHSLGAMFFGAAYLDLALAHLTWLAQDKVLQAVGVAAVLGWVLLAFRHWFLAPQVGLTMAALLYAAGLFAMHA